MRCVYEIKPEHKIKPEFLQISFRRESPTQTRVFISFLLPLNMSFGTLDARIDAAATMCTPGAYYFTKLLFKNKYFIPSPRSRTKDPYAKIVDNCR